MKDQLNTDSNMAGQDELARRIETAMEKSPGGFGDQITRVEVHLSDANSRQSGGDEKRCLMEVRLRGPAEGGAPTGGGRGAGLRGRGRKVAAIHRA